MWHLFWQKECGIDTVEKIGNKVSYIRKPLAKYSVISAGLAVFCCLFGVISIVLSYQHQGDAPLNASALGLCSVVTGISAIVYGVFSFFEKEKNYILAKISLVFAGMIMCFWLVAIVAAW